MTALFIFAHPDDESFSSGATIAKLVQKGWDVKLICATRGEEGELGNPPICIKSKVGETREKELLNAAKILGISRVFFLDFTDGTLKNIPKSKLFLPVLQIIQKEKPDLVFTFNKDGGSKHPDHIKMSKIATYAFDLYAKDSTHHVRLYYTAMPKVNVKILEKNGISYNAFGKIKGVNASRITTVVDTNSTFNKKIKALMCHKTQIKDVQRFLKTDKILKTRKEYFYLAREHNLV